MAMVSPYGDPNAHGPINKTLCFQRYKGSSFLRTFPRPVSRKTPALIIQRQKLTDAGRAYSLLPGESKRFYRRRASQQQRTSRNLFMSAHMKKYLPSINRPIPCKSIEDMVIFTPAGLYLNEIKISITNESPLWGLEIEDNCVAWWKLEDLLAEKGPALNEIGEVDWVPAKFNNGVYVNDDANYLSAGTGSWFTPNSFVIGSQILTDFSVVDGVPSDDLGHVLFSWYNDAANSFYFRVGPQGTYFVNRVNGTSYYLPLMTNINWDAHTLHHLLVVYVQAKIGDDQQRVYLDGNLIENRNVGAPVQTKTTGTSKLLTHYQNVQNWGGARR